MAAQELFGGVFAEGAWASLRSKAVVLDDRLWRYKKSKRHEWGLLERDRKLMRRAGPGSGLLVLRARHSSIHGQPEDAVLLGMAREIWNGGLLEQCAKTQQWPVALRAELDVRNLEIVVVPPDTVTVPWEEYERERLAQEIVDEAEEIASDSAEEIRETARLALAAEVEQRLLRAGVTFTTFGRRKEGQYYRRHPESGDLLDHKGKVVPEADVHEAGFDDWDDGVVMSYKTLLRLLKKIDPRTEEGAP